MKCTRWILFDLVLLSLGLHLWGIQRDLPYTPEADEHIFTGAAVRIVASGDLNPGWFGHPGSTVIYPLAGILHVWDVVSHDAVPLQPSTEFDNLFRRDISEFYLLGRLLTIAYSVLSIPLIYLAGKRLFNAQVGLLGGFLYSLYPVLVWHAQTVRTDTAAVFFGMLGLWLCLRAFDQPSLTNHILAGAAIGLGISSRYFMVTLLPLLVLLELMLWRKIGVVPVAVFLTVGAASALLVFLLTTPYFLIDFNTALTNLRGEARTVHAGADGLTPSGNFAWYLTIAIPLAVTLPQAGLAALGAVLAVLQRQLKPLLVLAFIAFFLVGISLSALHWLRWIIQLLPLLALFAVYALQTVLNWMGTALKIPPRWKDALLLVGVLALAARPAYELVLQDYRFAHPSTRVQARQWILDNVPAQSVIAQELYGAPLDGEDYQVFEVLSLAGNRGLADYAAQGFQYLVINSSMYNRFYAQPERYPAEISFYQSLFEHGELLKRFVPSPTQAGPEILIYRIPPP